MDKPILIDALYINISGGLMILNHLVDTLVSVGCDFVLIKDSRCPKLGKESDIKKIVVMQPSLFKRHNYYKSHKNVFRAILCMGNVPPTTKMDCHVYTYFHNVIVMSRPKGYPLMHTIRAVLKKWVIKVLSQNTDDWVVQTSNTKELVNKHLALEKQHIFVLPIYSVPYDLKILKQAEHGKDYIFIGQYTNAKGHDQLFKAWEMLYEREIKPVLHITVSVNYVLPRIKKLQQKGINIVNHGFVPYKDVIEIYRQGKALIYPSFNESFGLGIIEALEAGLDVITSNLPFALSICKPSIVFDPYSPQSIVDAVINYETNTCPKSEITVKDNVRELINLLTDN
jgi:glycosyltransferase involved in cell wall biosynthesis